MVRRAIQNAQEGSYLHSVLRNISREIHDITGWEDSAHNWSLGSAALERFVRRGVLPEAKRRFEKKAVEAIRDRKKSSGDLRAFGEFVRIEAMRKAGSTWATKYFSTSREICKEIARTYLGSVDPLNNAPEGSRTHRLIRGVAEQIWQTDFRGPHQDNWDRAKKVVRAFLQTNGGFIVLDSLYDSVPRGARVERILEHYLKDNHISHLVYSVMYSRDTSILHRAVEEDRPMVDKRNFVRLTAREFKEAPGPYTKEILERTAASIGLMTGRNERVANWNSGCAALAGYLHDVRRRYLNKELEDKHNGRTTCHLKCCAWEDGLRLLTEREIDKSDVANSAAERFLGAVGIAA